jgi:hypothetical protein
MHTDWRGVGQVTVDDDNTVRLSKWTTENAPGVASVLNNAQVIEVDGTILQIMQDDALLVSFAGNGEGWHPEINYAAGDTVMYEAREWIALPDVGHSPPDDVYAADGSSGGWMPQDEYDLLNTGEADAV